MCKFQEQCAADLKRFQETGELPPSWDPEAESLDGEFDRRLAEINAELDAIESGSAEPPPLGWLIEIGRQR